MCLRGSYDAQHNKRRQIVTGRLITTVRIRFRVVTGTRGHPMAGAGATCELKPIGFASNPRQFSMGPIQEFSELSMLDAPHDKWADL